VVNYFFWIKVSTNGFFNNKPMSSDVSILCGVRMVWYKIADITP